MTETPRKHAAVIGGGPAGLMAAETLAEGGVAVTVYERMPTVGRKLLMAGRGGLNLTHSEPFQDFVTRYGAARDRLEPLLRAFPPGALVRWAEALGQETFTGSSGRVFPRAMKASPLLRAWLAQLAERGVRFRTRHLWRGWTADDALRFETPAGEITAAADAVILALGGASWPRLGSDGSWAPLLADKGVAASALRPANCGFTVAWSDHFRSRFAGQPLKTVGLRAAGARSLGDAVITAYGIEGGAVYALGAAPREAIDSDGKATLEIDLRPALAEHRLGERLDRPRKGQSLANYLRKAAGLSPLEINLLREAHGVALPDAPGDLARAIKRLPVELTGVQPIERAISTAGGVRFDSLEDSLMLTGLPGVWAAGEMLDWEAPTGGYLLQACFASGRAAGKAALDHLADEPAPPYSGSSA